MLIACLVFGCSISSYAYRRQNCNFSSGLHLQRGHNLCMRDGFPLRTRCEPDYAWRHTLGYLYSDDRQSNFALASVTFKSWVLIMMTQYLRFMLETNVVRISCL